MPSDTTNLLHLHNPQPGDYWHEMLSPVARVIMVDDYRVLVQRLAGRAGTEITDNDPKPVVMTHKELAKWLTYDSIPNKTWADVVPRRVVSIQKPTEGQS